METIPNHAISIIFGIREIQCLNFSFTEYALDKKIEIPFEGYEFQFKLDLRLDEQKKLCECFFLVELFEKLSTIQKNKLAEMQTVTVFEVINYNDVIKKTNDGQVNIPDALIIICANTALSTTRGILSVKLEQSIYKNAIIPMIDGKTFLPAKN